jgi:hypothetical protein
MITITKKGFIITNTLTAILFVPVNTLFFFLAVYYNDRSISERIISDWDLLDGAFEISILSYSSMLFSHLVSIIIVYTIYCKYYSTKK